VANRRLRRELLEAARGLHEVGAIGRRTMRELELLRKAPKPKKRKVAGPRVACAPAPNLPTGAPLPPNRVVSVVLQPGEDVQWTWSANANGGSYVSGYTIIERSRRGRA